MQNKQKHLAVWKQYTFKQRVKTTELALQLKYLSVVFFALLML